MLVSGNEILIRVWDDLSPHLLIRFCRDWHRHSNKVGEVEPHFRLKEFIASGDPANGETTLLEHFTDG